MKRGCPDHPKMGELAALLGIPKYAANGLVERLFHFAAQYAPQGNVGKHANSRLARALDWQQPAQDWRKDSRSVRRKDKKARKLVDALVAAGWLDRCPSCRLYLHDWQQHRDNAVKKYLERNGLPCLHKDGTCLDNGQTESALPLPLPLPIKKPLPVKGSPSVGDPKTAKRQHPETPEEQRVRFQVEYEAEQVVKLKRGNDTA